MNNKRLYFVIVMILSLLSLFSFVCAAEETYNTESPTVLYSGRCGTDITWTLDDKGTLDISGTGEMYNYKYNESLYMPTTPFYNHQDLIKNVIISDGITTIGDYIFYSCDGIQSVIIPDSITVIGRQSFSSCTGLTKVTIPKNVTTIDVAAFYYCTSLKSITIPDSVTTIGNGAFRYCYKLNNISLPDTITSMGSNVFSETLAYKNAENWDNSVLYIGNYVLGSYSIKGAYSIREGTVAIAGLAFDKNNQMTDIIIPNTVVSIGSSAFEECSSLTNVTLPDSIKWIGSYAFYNCSRLKSITISDSVVSIASSTFQNTINVTIRCYANSYAHTYARQSAIPFELLPCRNCVFTEYLSDENGTCTENGTMSAYCDNGCGTVSTITEENSKKHEYAIIETIEATCIDNGKIVYLCSRCNDSYETLIPLPGPHSFQNYEYNNDAFCTNDGTKTAKCEFCDATDTVSAEGTELGHSFSEYVSDNNTTCTKDGTKTAICDNGCGETDTVPEEAKGHIGGEWVVVKAPTCLNEGYKEQKCTLCSEILNSEIIPMLEYEGFPDVWENAWYAEGVKYCFAHEYILGTDEGIFEPNKMLTREQLVVVLARVAGAELGKYTDSPFDDVRADSWYGASVIWANDTGVVNGIGNDNFGVGQHITREQLAVIFYRYTENRGIDVSEKFDLSQCKDASDISTWALDACAWAIRANLLSSTSKTESILSPKMPVTRGQAAKIFMSFDSYAEN